MADIDFDEFDAGYGMTSASPRRYDRLVQLAGAGSSVLLVVGALWWGYQLAVRDVSGVPVMRALGGPMRVAPADPGGEVALGQGLSVNAVAAAGTAAPLPDELYLAPRTQELAEEDAAGLAVALAPDDAEQASLPEAALGTDQATDISMAAEIPLTDSDAVAAALNEALLGGEAPVSDAGLASSPRPKARVQPRSDTANANALMPAAVESGAVEPGPAPNDAVATGPVPTEIDLAQIAVGTRLVQLGAFDTPDAARAEWSVIQARFPELMATKSLVIQPAQSGGKTFYRLRAHGFETDDDSRRFCTALVSENRNCIPVTQR